MQNIIRIHQLFLELSCGQGKTNRQTDRRTDKLTPIYPPKLRLWGYNDKGTSYVSVTDRQNRFWLLIFLFSDQKFNFTIKWRSPKKWLPEIYKCQFLLARCVVKCPQSTQQADTPRAACNPPRCKHITPYLSAHYRISQFLEGSARDVSVILFFAEFLAN